MAQTQGAGVGNPPPQSGTNKWMGIAAVVAVVAVGGFFLLQSGGNRFASSKDPLHLFYPENTAFYLEFEPGPKLAQGFVDYAVDRQNQTLAARSAMMRQLASQPGMASLPPSALPTNAFDEAMTRDFIKTFAPHFSVGAWPSNPTAPKETDFHNFLVVLPFAQADQGPSPSVPDLLAKMKRNPQDFEQKDHQGVAYWVEKTPPALPAPAMPGPKGMMTTPQPPTQAAMMVLDNKLMIGPSAEVMTGTIDRFKNHSKNVYDNKSAQKGLALLDKGREGTLIINNSVYEGDPATPSAEDSKTGTAPKDPRAAMRKLLPGVFGGLEVADDTTMEAEFYVPLEINHIKDKTLQERVVASLKEKPATFQAASRLPDDTQFFLAFGHLADLLDLSLNHMADPQQKAQMDQTKAFMAMIGLDLERDLLGLFKGEFVVAMHRLPEQPPLQSAMAVGQPRQQQGDIPMLLMDDPTTKGPILTKLLTMASQMMQLQHGTQQMGALKVDTFKAKGDPAALAIAPVNGVMALTDPQQMERLVALQENKSKPLGQLPLYQELTGKLPASGNGMVFMNMTAKPRDFMQAVAGVWQAKAEQKGNERLEGHLIFRLSPAAAGTTSQANTEKATDKAKAAKS